MHPNLQQQQLVNSGATRQKVAKLLHLLATTLVAHFFLRNLAYIDNIYSLTLGTPDQIMTIKSA